MIPTKLTNALLVRIAAADESYGPFASTHEALGVCSEEWDELRAAIHANDAAAIQAEALDLAAALIRLHDHIHFFTTASFRKRSGIDNKPSA